MMAQVGRSIGGKIGDVIDVDCSLGGVAWGRCLRVRVLLDVSQPLCRGTVFLLDRLKLQLFFAMKSYQISAMFVECWIMWTKTVLPCLILQFRVLEAVDSLVHG